jgi:hypothetical protein
MGFNKLLSCAFLFSFFNILFFQILIQILIFYSKSLCLIKTEDFMYYKTANYFGQTFFWQNYFMVKNSVADGGSSLAK